MKPSDIVKLDEGPLDWIARKGFLGKSKQIAAVGSKLDQEQSAMQTAAEKTIAAQSKRQFDQLLKNLPVAIARAYKSSVVAESSLKKDNYRKFDQLIESLILNEAMSLPDFMKEYIRNLAGRVQISPAIQSVIDQHIADFARYFIYNPAKTPEQHTLNPGATKAITNIWDAIQTAKLTQQQAATPATKKTPPPSGIAKVVMSNATFLYDPATSQWTRETDNKVVTSPDNIEKLNKKAKDDDITL